MSTRMVPFIFSSTIAYQIEMGEFFATFFFDGALLDGDGAPIATPYLEADLPELHFRQIADTMWITHPDYKTRKLTRTTVTTFSLDVVTFTTGPFLVRNDLAVADDVTMKYTGTLTKDAVGTLTASSAHFESGHVGALFELTHLRSLTDSKVETTGASDSSFLDVKGPWGFNTSGTWSGTVRIIRNQDGLGDETFRTFVANTIGARNIQLNRSGRLIERQDNVQYKIVTEAGMSADFSADLTVNSSTKVGIVRIDSITSTTVAACTVLTPIGGSSGTTTKRWAEGAWSGVQGYAKSIAFFAERAIYVGGRNVWLSRVGDFENFDAGVLDADAFTVSLSTTNEAMWVDTVDKVIVIGTTGPPWTAQSNKVSTPISPTNFTVDEQSGFGSADIQGVKVNNAIIFVDFVQKKLHEFAFNADEQKYRTPELTILAEHFSNSSTVTWLAHQKNPESIIWFGLADGTLHSFTYQRDQNVLAYAAHPTDGNVRSGSVIPSTGEDEVWFSVERNLDGVEVTCIERMTVRTVTDDDDFHHVDCAVIYDDVAATVISGGTHLENETVAILADGVSVAPQTVSSGTITLTTAASKVHYGLPMTPQVKPMRLDVETGEGSSHGSIAQIPTLVLSLLNSKNVAFGDSISTLVDVNLDHEDLVNNTEITDVFTGDATVSQDGGFSIEDSIVISSSKTNSVTDATPLTVRAIIARKDITGR